MSLFRFSKPRTPGFGISSEYYLTVLATVETLPTLLTLINPRGDGGATVGFGVPLRRDAVKEELNVPLQRGTYGLASKDRKTALKMRVMTVQEINFDPLAFSRSAAATTAEPELLRRMALVKHLCQFNFESHDPTVAPALNFILGLVVRLATITDGVIADPLAERYLLPQRAIYADRLDVTIDARNHVSIGLRLLPTGLHAYTRGLRKFLLPELEIQELRDGDESIASRLLMSLAQRCLQGQVIQENERLGKGNQSLFAQPGGLDSALWQGCEVLELRPPVGGDASAAIRAISNSA